jgi:hypothetical protein
MVFDIGRLKHCTRTGTAATLLQTRGHVMASINHERADDAARFIPHGNEDRIAP